MRRFSALWLLLLYCVGAAQAAGPRYVTGYPYFTGQAGRGIPWRGPTLLYSTDPGGLGPNVNHAAADALVAAAAGVWNVPVASITLSQGQALAEHVSGQNVYMGANGMVFPADVMASNAAAVPLAIVYDTDGSVTDTLLGAGASLPSGCRQNGVTESVDAFDPAGYIKHAIIIVNGRCTGTAPEAQLQLRYQLMRVFGRVLGLAWSQTNDNVFTGVPRPTPVQAQYWPIMHPIDILCGPYSYQCLPNPFMLRPDDIGGLVGLYPIDGSNGVPPGKQLSYASAQGVTGRLFFPTGEGMAGVNVVVSRIQAGTTDTDAFYVASGVSGAYAVRGRASSFATAGSSALASQGDTDPTKLAVFLVPWYPVLGPTAGGNRITTTEPINPLYMGEYTLGPYPAGNVQPSGSPVFDSSGGGPGVSFVGFTAADAAGACGTGADGTPASPVPVDPTGWWPGLICGYGHVSYLTATVRPGRTFTLETTALDAQGLPTTTKLMPVLGLFGPYDAPPYYPPTLGTSLSAFNGLTLGTTTLHAGTGNATGIKFGIADQRGDGRPDFNYQARLFYADSLAPAQVAAAGGTLTISGLGFRNGNAVSVNGVAATVLSWSANAIVVTVPSAVAAGASVGVPVDVTVSDRGTGATTTMTAALTYSGSAQAKSMRLISAPAGTQLVGDVAAIPFSVQLVRADGTTPVANASVTFSTSAGAVAFSACAGAASCTRTTDANGLATTQVTPAAAGSVTVRAVSGSLAQSATFAVIAQASQMLVVSLPETPLRVGLASSSAFAVKDVGPDGTTALPGRAVTFSATAGSATFDACFASPCTVYTDWTGTARVGVIPQSTGPVTVQARDGDLSQTVTVSALSNSDLLRVNTAPPAQLYPHDAGTFAVTLYKGDGVTPDHQSITFTAPAGLQFYQCATQVCTLTSSYDGYTRIDFVAITPGTYTLQAQYGSVTQAVTVTVIAHTWQLKVLSVPADGSPTGAVAAVPFRVQVVLDDGVTPAPIAGRSLILGGDTGAIGMTACPFSACELYVGSDAIATAWIIPQQGGPLTLSAIFAPLVTSATFTASGGARTMKIVAQPGADGVPPGQLAYITVQVIGPDGVTPLSNDHVDFTVLSGPFTFFGGSADFPTDTRGDGTSAAPGLATGSGPVVVQATDGFVTRLISFLAGTPPRVLKLVSVPASPADTGSVAARPFQVQVFAQDGITPAAGEQVTFSLTGGNASFSGCAASPCVVTADAQGLAQVQITPHAGGVIGLLAADGPATLATSFLAVAQPDILRITGVPADGSFTGTPATRPFTLQVLLADGITPAPGKPVVLSAASGTATFAACAGTATCTLTSDASGTLSTFVTPTTAGPITLQAQDGSTIVTATFTASARPDTLRLVSAPANQSGIGYASSTPFAVQVVQADRTPAAGKTVVFSVTAGSVRFGACNAATCTVTTAADGTASTTVTPLAAGAVTLLATEGSLTQTATFLAVDPPDILRITGVPADGSYTGTPATRPFTLQVLLADGITPAPGKPVVLSAASGTATFAACAGTATCTLTSDASGTLSTFVTPTTAGPITLQAQDGSTIVTATFTASARPDTLRLVSAPANQSGIGYASSTPFAVQVVQADRTPAAGKTVVFSVTDGSVRFGACNAATCTVTTAADGTASTTVTPLAAGAVTLLAAEGSLTQTATFLAVAQPDILRITGVPADGSFTGTPATRPFTLQVLLADGITPAPGKAVVLSAASGTATFAACAGTGTCTLTSDASGTLTTPVTPTTAGPITLQAQDGSTIVTATFTASARPDTLRLVSAPANPSGIGYASSTPFAVQVVQADGTRAAGKTVVFSATAGSVRFGACAAATCTVTTAADGTASTTVMPLAAGAITLLATEGSLTQTATFLAVAQPDMLRITSAPADGSFTGIPATRPFTLQVLLADGITPAPGKAVVLSATSGTATFAACAGAATCTLTSDASGNLSTPVTPTTAGPITLQAQDGNVTARASFSAVSRPDTMRLVNAPTGAVGNGYAAAVTFTVQVLQGDGTPAAGKTVLFAATTGSVRFGACAAATCTVTTAADGTAATTVTPLTLGSVTLLATESAPSQSPPSQSAAFLSVAEPDILGVTSAPADGSYTGIPANTPFRVQVLLADGLTPAAARPLTFAVPSGSATFAACAGTSTCTLVTDAAGLIASAVTPGSGGTILLQAVDGSVTASASFSAFARPDTMQLRSAPSGSLPTGVQAATSFSVQLLAGDGSPDAGQPVLFTATGAGFPRCVAFPCTVPTDATGTATVFVTPDTAGTVTLKARFGALTQSASFTAYERPDTLRLVSAPASGSLAGAVAAQPFTVQVLAGEGTPAPGRGVTLSVAAGSATFPACATPCALITDADGRVSTPVLPGAAGSITLLATEAQASVTATFSAAAKPQPDLLRLVSAPSGSVYSGSPAAIPFAVQLVASDGKTPRPGVAVVFSFSGASTTFAACASSPCTLVSDANGIASSTVTPLAPGVVTLNADAGNVTLSAAFNAQANQYGLATQAPAQYIAEGAIADLMLDAEATQNGVPAPSLPVRFSVAPGLRLATPDSTTDSTGRALALATAGPLAAGTSVKTTACAWSNVCVDFAINAVSADDFEPSFLEGATQSAQGSAALQPVTILVSDSAGHPVAGAPIRLYQTVTAYAGACPAQGRCPSAPVLASQVTVAVADATGRYTFAPMSGAGQATQTEIAVSAGTSGFATTTLLQRP